MNERERPQLKISLRLRRAHLCLVTFQVYGVLSGVEMEACVRLPVIQRADSAADSGIALADRSLPLT